MSSYTINVPDEALETLKQKLSTTTLPDELESNDEWAYGAPLNDIRRLTSHWKNNFDWRKAEAELNELPQFMTTITPTGYGPLDIHFVHQQSPSKTAIPLLFVHGWPGSFIEVKKLLPSLKGDTKSPAFHVVAPSLPNFGFSGVVKTPGFNIGKYAETCHKLMLQLGYKEYVTQGGDWGFFITRALGYLYPESVKASHINMILAPPPKFSSNPILATQHAVMPYSTREKAGLARSAWFSKEGSGYHTEQRTKPQTLGYGLADSPVAVLAWIYEKLHDWTDNYPWTDDEILTWISIYWFSTAGPAASVRIYYEEAHSPMKVSSWIPKVPLGLAFYPKELSIVPQTWARTLGPVAYEAVREHGGHFAAWEHPEEIARDLKTMFGKKGPCYGVVKGATGYEKSGARL